MGPMPEEISKPLAEPSAPASAWREEAAHVVDTAGLSCPEPLMLLRNQMRTVAPGDSVAVIATDPSTVRDFTNFCRFQGHRLAYSEQRDDRFLFVIRKQAAPAA